MERNELLNNISESELEKMSVCFKPGCYTYRQGETIMCYSDEVTSIGFLTKGSAHLSCIDSEGDCGLLEHYGERAVFGFFFITPIKSLEYVVTADTDCSVMLLDYSHILHPCSSLCEHHSILIKNLFELTARKSRELTLHINILSRKTVRGKLLLFFEYESLKAGSESFRLSCSLTELSLYLCVDRSAVMKELRKMKAEGVLSSCGRDITLL